jgi:hypothetical protein
MPAARSRAEPGVLKHVPVELNRHQFRSTVF